MDKCPTVIVPVQKGDKFSLMHCPKNDVEFKEMESIPYAFIVGSLMYVQTRTKLDISFTVRVLGRYRSNPGRKHYKATNKVLRYLQGMKNYMLMYRKCNHLEVIRYLDSNFAGCVDGKKSTYIYLFMLAEGIIS